MNEQERIVAALEIAGQYGGDQGAHHKAWVIDQMVRALTGSPTIERQATDYRGQPYTYHAYGESEEYLRFVAEAKAGEDGPETYEWDIGIAP